MSDATKSAIDTAVRAHLADIPDFPNAVLTDWVVLASAYNPGDESSHIYLRVVADQQAIHRTLGLIAEASQVYAANATASVIAEES